MREVHIMCIFPKSTEAPATPAKQPEAAQTPVVAPTARRRDDDAKRRRRAGAAGGLGVGTILTGPRGVTEGAATSAKTLLGQ